MISSAISPTTRSACSGIDRVAQRERADGGGAIRDSHGAGRAVRSRRRTAQSVTVQSPLVASIALAIPANLSHAIADTDRSVAARDSGVRVGINCSFRMVGDVGTQPPRKAGARADGRISLRTDSARGATDLIRAEIDAIRAGSPVATAR
jgi:hypothetical protein